MKLVPQLAFRIIRSPARGGFSSLASLLAIIGLAVGIAALLLTFSILQGFENTLSNKIARFDGHIRIEHFLDAPLAEDDILVDSVLAAQSRNYTSIEYIQKSALIRKGRQAEGVLIDALPQSKISTLKPLLDSIPQFSTTSWIIPGDRLAQALHLQKGDKVVIFPLESVGKSIFDQKMQVFTVLDIFHSGLFEYDKTVAYIELSEAQKLFQMENQISGRKIVLHKTNQMGNIYQQLENGLPYPYYVQSWKEKHNILFQWMATQKIPILIFFGLITMVGVVNIVAALTMIVIEKIRTIGVLKSMGFPKKSILEVFTLDGIVIGFLGTLSGVVMAFLIAWIQGQWNILSIPEDVYFMDRVPFHFTFWLIMGHIIAGIVVSSLASILPAVRASTIEAATAVRYE